MPSQISYQNDKIPEHHINNSFHARIKKYEIPLKRTVFIFTSFRRHMDPFRLFMCPCLFIPLSEYNTQYLFQTLPSLELLLLLLLRSQQSFCFNMASTLISFLPHLLSALFLTLTYSIQSNVSN
jgi:hypothetical protein